MQSSIKKIVWGCLLVIPFLALHVADGGMLDVISWFTGSSMFFPFISGKNILFRVLVEVALAGWIILAIGDASYRISVKKSPIIIAYSLFIAVLFFADLLGVDREKSLWSNFERMEGFVGHVHLFAYFLVLSVMVRALAEWQRLWKYFVVSNVITLAYGFFQLFGASHFFLVKLAPKLASWFSAHFQFHAGGERVDSTLGNSAYFGVYALIHAFIITLLWSQSDNAKNKRLYPALVVLNVIGVLISGTRGSMVGLFAGAFVVLGILAWKGEKRMRNLFVKSLAVAIVLLALLFGLKNTPIVQSSQVLSRIASISPNDITGASRLAIWAISYEAWKERPLLGYGQDNFGHIFARKFLPEKMCNLEPWYDRSHDVFFDWLVAAGVLGLVTYLSLYAVTLWYMWRKETHIPDTEKAILTGAIVGYFIHNVFVFDNLTSYILFFALLAYIVSRAQGERPHGKASLNEDQMNLIVIPIVGIALLVTLYTVNYRPVMVNGLVIRAMSIGEYAKKMPLADAVKLAQDSFTSAIAMKTLGSIEAREQFLQMAIRLAQVKLPDDMPQGDKQKTAQALNDFLGAARKDIVSSFDANKDDVRMLSIYGMFFNGVNDPVPGEEVLTRAYTLAPNKQLIAFDLIRSKLLQRKFAEGYELAKHTYDLSITCTNALKWLMLSASYAGKYEEAYAYAQSKGQNPGFDPDTLAGIVSSGQISLAVKVLEQIKKDNPSLAPQVDEYLRQLAQKK